MIAASIYPRRFLLSRWDFSFILLTAGCGEAFGAAARRKYEERYE
jgi:hypothetical protein